MLRDRFLVEQETIELKRVIANVIQSTNYGKKYSKHPKMLRQQRHKVRFAPFSSATLTQSRFNRLTFIEIKAIVKQCCVVSTSDIKRSYKSLKIIYLYWAGVWNEPRGGFDASPASAAPSAVTSRAPAPPRRPSVDKGAVIGRELGSRYNKYL